MTKNFFVVEKVRDTPFPHVLKDGFVEPKLYETLKSTFPLCPTGKSGPTGNNLFWGDAGYEALMAKPGWRTLYKTVHSQQFVEYCKAQFSGYWKREGCRIDLSRARYTAYHEDRVDKERRHLRKVELEPHDVWVRMDVLQGKIGYRKLPHLDHRRRLAVMLIYFCDAEESEMEGGRLALHGSNPLWFLSRPVLVPPRDNRMVMFPACARSRHSVTRIKKSREPRNFVQVHLSSSVRAWD